ncbi:hypothetical protein [Longimicrobium sp.]|uniref:hypothetical protein n=1 Tax=Longimicrobium sp. TaxID=2029185 RepID=UPI002E37B079|nr:hypothetical protein [Longimicrobium sp.]HEX6037247.1 hypothetical protein [Longimicrobium sp.]
MDGEMKQRPAHEQDPFQSLLEAHGKLNQGLVSGVEPSLEEVEAFFGLAQRVLPVVEFATEREEIRDFLRIWGSYLGTKGRVVPEIKVEERIPLVPDLQREDWGTGRHPYHGGVSVHIGINAPLSSLQHARPLAYAELAAWRLAELASQAGYESVLVLQGRRATLSAVHHALVNAAEILTSGDVFFFSFTGFGTQATDADWDERPSGDDGWCLADGVLLKDTLAGYLRLFKPGVRIVVVEEGGFRGGSVRDDDDERGEGAWGYRLSQYQDRHKPRDVSDKVVYRDDPVIPRYRGEVYRDSGAVTPATWGEAPCIAVQPFGNDGIRASVLVLSGSQEDAWGQDGLFTRHLLEAWDEGSFRGSFCQLYQAVWKRVVAESTRQKPQIRMMGLPDPEFPFETAFHLKPKRSDYR